MPVSYSFDSRIVVVRATGEYSPHDLQRTVLAALDDAACPAAPSILLDVSESEVLLRRSAAQIIKVAESLLTYASRLGARHAFVVGSTAGYGLVRMGAEYASAEGLEHRVFRDFDEARAWLLS